MDVITFPKIYKALVVYRFYCMALFHSQMRRYMIIIIIAYIWHYTSENIGGLCFENKSKIV